MAPWSIVLSLLSAFVGASLNNLYNRLHVRKQNRLQTTLRVFEEFNSKEMFESRQQAYDLLKKNLSCEYPLPLNDLSSKFDSREINHVFRVLYFFEKLVVLDRYRQLESSLAWRLFDIVYSYWLCECIEPQLKVEMGVNSNWADLLLRVSGIEAQLQKGKVKRLLSR